MRRLVHRHVYRHVWLQALEGDDLIDGRKCASVYTCVYTCAHTCVCTGIRHLHMHVHTHVQAQALEDDGFIDDRTRLLIVDIPMCVPHGHRVRVCTCMRMRVRVCVRACMRACVCPTWSLGLIGIGMVVAHASMHMSIHMSAHVCIRPDTCLHARGHVTTISTQISAPDDPNVPTHVCTHKTSLSLAAIPVCRHAYSQSYALQPSVCHETNGPLSWLWVAVIIYYL